MAEKAKGPELIQRLLELAWKPKKIFLQTGALIIAYFIFLIFCAIAPAAPKAEVWAGIIIFIGKILAYFVILFAMTAVAKITLAEVRGEEEVRAGAALGAAGAKIKDVVASPLKIFAILAGLVVFHGIIDLWGKIPFIGELCWMFSPVITFPLGIAIVATILTLIFGAMVLPTVIILGKEGPVSELIDFLRKNTIKFAGHFLIALVVAVITFVILLWAIQLSRGVSQAILGDKYTYVQSHIPDWVQPVPGFKTMARISEIAPAEIFTRPVILGLKAERWTLVIAGFIFGVILWLIHMSIWGFILVDFSVAGTLSYIGLTGAAEEEREVVPEEKEEKPAPKSRKPRAKKPAPKKEEKKE